MGCADALLQISHVTCGGLCLSLPDSVHLGGCWGLSSSWMVFLGLLVAGVDQGM